MVCGGFGARHGLGRRDRSFCLGEYAPTPAGAERADDEKMNSTEVAKLAGDDPLLTGRWPRRWVAVWMGSALPWSIWIL